MKIGILSDTHMIKECIDKTIPYLKDCDLIIHAGDNFSDSKYIHNMTKVGIMAVKGNCNFDNVEDELIFDIEEILNSGVEANELEELSRDIQEFNYYNNTNK